MVDNNKILISTTTKKVSVVELTYDGNNVSQLKSTTTEGEKDPVIEIFKFTYDNKVNPYFHALCLISEVHIKPEESPKEPFKLLFSSENNILSLSDQTDPKNIKERTYIYEYNSNNFPTKQDERIETIKKVNQWEETTIRTVNHKIFYYEYEE